MAVVVAGSQINKGSGEETVQWVGLANGDTGSPVFVRDGFEPKSMQVTGTFGSGGSVACEGSNDGAAYAALDDPAGTTIAVTAAGVAGIGVDVLAIRPHVTAGDGTTALTVTILLRARR